MLGTILSTIFLFLGKKKINWAKKIPKITLTYTELPKKKIKIIQAIRFTCNLCTA